VVLTARGRAAYGLGTAVLLTVALLGWESRSLRSGHPPPAAEGTLIEADRPSTPAIAQPPARSVPPPARSSRAPQPAVIPTAASGRLAVVSGDGAVRGTGPPRRYRVAVEAGLPVSAPAFAAAVERTLADPRSWGAGGQFSFQRVGAGRADFTVVLASAATTDRLCRPLDTARIYSCFNKGMAVLNYLRWQTGAAAYEDDLASYRQYVVLHEVGHALGHGHELCRTAGGPAPTMMQQTKGVGACRPNPWPYPEED